MSLSNPSRPRGVTPTGSSTALVRYATATGAALAVSLGLAAFLSVQTSGPNPAAPLVIGGVAAAVAVAATVVFAARLVAGGAHRRCRTAATLAWIEDLQPAGPAAVASRIPSQVAADREDDVREAPETRALRLHISALESVLEERSSRLARLEQDVQARDGNKLERVLVTVGALRDRADGDPGAQQVLDRVEAAISRLAVSANPGRPPLPPRRASSPQPPSSTAAADPVRPGASTSHARPTTATTTSAPAEPPAATSETPVGPTGVPPVPPARDDDGVVLPVPAPTLPQTTRTRRRFRRRAFA